MSAIGTKQTSVCVASMSALEVKRHHPHLKVMSAFDHGGHFIAPPKARRVLFVTALNSSVSRIGRKSCLDFDLSWSRQLL